MVRKESGFDGSIVQDGEQSGYESVAASGLVVRRSQLVSQIMLDAAEHGVVLFSAPEGFGKTAVLLQCVSAAQTDDAHGEAHLIDAGRLSVEQLVERLDVFARTERTAPCPLVAVDDVPKTDRAGAEALAACFSALVARGCELLVACMPTNRALIAALPHARHVVASDLAVQPREYSEWARLYSISRSLDVYDLTCGIPSLVTMLQFATDHTSGGEMLEQAVGDLDHRALAELRRERDTLYRPACLMLLLGDGTIDDFERCGVKMHRETMERLARDYPMFGLDTARRTFACLGRTGAVARRLRREIAQRRPEYASRAARVLMRAGRVDAAVELADLVLDEAGRLSLINQFPVQFALAGQAQFVQRSMAQGERMLTVDAETGVLVAAFASALTLGDLRMARTAASELRRRAEAVAAEVDAGTWECVCDLAEVWGTVTGIELPDARGAAPADGDASGIEDATRMLRTHVMVYRELVGGAGRPVWGAGERLARGGGANALDIPALLLAADRCLDRALHGEGVAAAELAQMDAAIKLLGERHLVPVAARIRLAAGIARLYGGEPLLDERSFADAGTMAVRESDLTTQLFCLAAEGWQALSLGQAINAHFRGQQVLKLAGPDHEFLRSWGTMLERTAYLRRASRVKIREEAEVIDLSQGSCSPAAAWGVALHLAAARFDSELSAWCSRHKEVMLENRFLPTARHALGLLGSRAEALRHLMPREAVQPAPDTRPVPSEKVFEVIDGGRPLETGEVIINLFGGFHVERNGHVLTDALWRRKKAGVLAAHLALAMGSFVSRRTIVDELWPDADYAHGRESLYVTLSSLRAAMKQGEGGPQYVLTQGDGVALNSEYVYSDVRQFDTLARSVLLAGEGVSAQQVIEICLKIEQLYRGPLYVPDSGDPTFFIEMRRTFLTKFVDCMVTGVDMALQIENSSCASWLIDAALKQAPTREDVIRRAMTVYDLCGRRREIVELYNGHLHYLQRELEDYPEEETREVYDRIINRQRRVAML